MDICIVGLGAVGSLLAAGLTQHLPAATHRVSAFARGATLAALQKNGLQIDSEQGLRSLPLRASDSAAELGPQDLVIVAVKAPALASVAPAVQALCGPDTAVLVALNGVPWWFFDGLPGPCAGLRLPSVDAGGLLTRLMPTQQLVGCVVHASSSCPAPGVLQHGGGKGLIIGRPAGGVDAPLQALGALLGQAGFEVTVSARIQREVWFKLWGNMTMNPLSALTGATVDRILDDPLLRAFASAIMLEAQQLGAAFGIPIEQQPDDRHAVTRKLGAFKTSMLQDLQAGRALELDALVGAVRDISHHLSLTTPNIDALFGLTRVLAQQRGLYPA